MDNINKKFVDSLIEAEKQWRSADHLIYITLPVVKDTRLLLRALDSINKSVTLSISTILKFEYLYKRVELSADSGKNLETFFKKCAGRYGLNEQDNKDLKRILFLGKKHKESGFEFSKYRKVVILDDNLTVDEVTDGQIKEFLKVSRKIIEKSLAILKGQS